MKQYLNTLRRLERIEVHFKTVEGYFLLDELQIKERTGYALFKNIRDPKITVYITVIAPTRQEVLRQLTHKILDKLFWTSRLDMSWIPKDK